MPVDSWMTNAISAATQVNNVDVKRFTSLDPFGGAVQDVGDADRLVDEPSSLTWLSCS